MTILPLLLLHHRCRFPPRMQRRLLLCRSPTSRLLLHLCKRTWTLPRGMRPLMMTYLLVTTQRIVGSNPTVPQSTRTKAAHYQASITFSLHSTIDGTVRSATTLRCIYEIARATKVHESRFGTPRLFKLIMKRFGESFQVGRRVPFVGVTYPDNKWPQNVNGGTFRHSTGTIYGGKRES